jgi:hypothetical protein
MHPPLTALAHRLVLGMHSIQVCNLPQRGLGVLQAPFLAPSHALCTQFPPTASKINRTRGTEGAFFQGVSLPLWERISPPCQSPSQNSNAHPKVGGCLTSSRGVARLGCVLATGEWHQVNDEYSRVQSTRAIPSASWREEIRLASFGGEPARRTFRKPGSPAGPSARPARAAPIKGVHIGDG